MGGPMARRLAPHFDMVVADSNPEMRAPFEALGCRTAVTAAQVAAAADIVLMSLPTPAAVQAVCTAEEGLFSAQGARIVVDLSTTGPGLTRMLAQEAAHRGIAFVDAPVSGGVPAARRGELAVMVSGPPPALATVRPILSLLGSRLFTIGDQAGLGQAMKLVNNVILACTAVATFEGLVLGAKIGLDSRTMTEVLNCSSARSFITQDKLPRALLDRSFPAGFATSLLLKDVGLCISEAKQAGVALHLPETTRHFLEEAVAQGYGDEDYARTIELLETAAGTRLVATPA